LGNFLSKLATIIVAPLALAGTAQAQDKAPKLIVAISIDQFSANLFEEWRPRFKAGLKRLASGIVYPSGYQSHAATETCPGHSTLLTGRHPNKTGIVGNTMRDEQTGKAVYCLNDPDVVLAHDRTASPVGPKRLMVDTLGDWLKAASPASRVVAISGKDRGAINMAGHHPDAVFWMIPGYGFTTYTDPAADTAKALEPVNDLNRDLSVNWQRPPAWNYTDTRCRAAEATWTVSGAAFASRVPPSDYAANPAEYSRSTMASPANDEMTLAGARHLIRHFKLGQGSAADLLAISFSGTDLIGHAYGSRGPEMCEQLNRLDRAIGVLLTDLDELKVPYLVVLSADHGGSTLVEQLAEQGYPAARIDDAAILRRLNERVKAVAGLETAPFTGRLEDLTLGSSVSPADRARVLAAAKVALGSEPDVAAAYTLDEVLATKVPADMAPDELSVEERFALSAYRGRSADLLVALRPYSSTPGTVGRYVAGHGSPWNYDRRVPIMFWWPGAAAQTRFLPVRTVDIAPTLATALHLTPPADIDGRCLALGALNVCPKPSR
jgi:predicted AlkP superfamily pyrophosphatase or phosphodiesterase